MSGILYHNPAKVIVQLLLDLELVSPAEGTGEWPCYYSHTPDDDDCVTVFDTDGKQQGKTHTDGEVQEHHGQQIAVRSNDVAEGYAKALEIALALDPINNIEVVLDECIYRVDAITRQGSVISAGIELGVSRRRLFTVNVITGLRFKEFVGTGT